MMRSAQRATTPVGIDIDIIQGRYADLGDYTVSFESFKQDVDTSPDLAARDGDLDVQVEAVLGLARRGRRSGSARPAPPACPDFPARRHRSRPEPGRHA